MVAHHAYHYKTIQGRQETKKHKTPDDVIIGKGRIKKGEELINS